MQWINLLTITFGNYNLKRKLPKFSKIIRIRLDCEIQLILMEEDTAKKKLLDFQQRWILI